MSLTSPALNLVQAEDVVLQLEYDLADILREDRGLHEREAFELARSLVQGMRRRYGGMQLGRRGLYIPAPSKAVRNAQICQEFNGRNAKEVCKKHGIKRSRLYQIISRESGKPVGTPSAAAPAAVKSPVSSCESGQAKR